MGRLPWSRRVGASGRSPITGIWARETATSVTIQRRIAELVADGPLAEVLAAAVAAGERARQQVHLRCAAAAARWPEPALVIPATADGRAVYEQVRELVAAQRAVLHRATLLTMPAGPAEPAVLIAGLQRAVANLREAVDVAEQAERLAH